MRRQWDDKSIENQLNKLPKIADRRSKDEVFQQIQGGLQETQFKQPKKKAWFIPTLATAAVFFLVLLIIPSFLNEENLSSEAPEFSEEVRMMDLIPEDAASITAVEGDDNLEKQYMANMLYFGANDLEEAITISVPAHSPQGELFVVPISLFAEGRSALEKLASIKDLFQGAPYGVEGFPPIHINSIYEGEAGVVVIDVPKNSLESLASAQSVVYLNALKETFLYLGYTKIELTSDGEPGVIWGQNGFLYEVEVEKLNRGYYAYESNAGSLFLVRGVSVGAPLYNANLQLLSVEETFEYMKQSIENTSYSPSIPNNIVIEKVETANDTATIIFSDKSIVEDSIEVLVMLEAMMFTLKDFGYDYVNFNAINDAKVGPYFLNQTIKIPRNINFLY